MRITQNLWKIWGTIWGLRFPLPAAKRTLNNLLNAAKCRGGQDASDRRCALRAVRATEPLHSW